jgi:hypothetical protein
MILNNQFAHENMNRKKTSDRRASRAMRAMQGAIVNKCAE